jgi:hypothetical protein
MKYRVVLLVVLIITSAGCKLFGGPYRTGEFRLSSEKSLSGSYYVYGYSYEDGEFYRFPYEKDPLPDIINEGYRIIGEGGQYELPGFNTPGQMNGFALVGEFETLNEAKSFYKGYKTVENDLQFETVSDTVELYQVWVQKTSAGNYVKLLVKEVESLEGDLGNKYSEVLLDYTYQPNGSTDFPN